MSVKLGLFGKNGKPFSEYLPVCYLIDEAATLVP